MQLLLHTRYQKSAIKEVDYKKLCKFSTKEYKLLYDATYKELAEREQNSKYLTCKIDDTSKMYQIERVLLESLGALL